MCHRLSGVLCGQDVAQTIVQCLSREIAILVHSNNALRVPVLVFKLCRTGSEVAQMPMAVLTKELFEDWLRKVSDNWESISGLAD